MNDPYKPRRASTSDFLAIRGLQYHVRRWDGGGHVPIVMLHGWMDVSASFQFVVDAMRRERTVLAPDWRGYGLSDNSGADTYWFGDYLGDLDALLDVLVPGQAVDLVGHSMGGNNAMFYAGLRPERVRKLVNLEGYGMPETRPDEAPKRLLKWLDELKTPARLRSYDSIDAVAERLLQNNPQLAPDKAAWLALEWSALRDDGRWHIRGDPAHKRANPVLSRRAEALAIWQRISAPLLWVEGDRNELEQWWGGRYPRSDFDERLAVVPDVRRERLAPAGHMLHHDQPEALARLLDDFLG